MDSWLVIFILGNLAIFTVLGLGLLALRARKIERRSRDRLELAERFRSAEELQAFLESEAGKRYLEGLGTRRADPRHTILASLPVGLMATFIGIGLELGIASDGLSEDLHIVAIVFLGAGLGILLSALVSYGLARAWGLIGER